MKKLSLVLGMMLTGATGMVAADSLYVDASGNVGVGTNVPDKALHVVNDTSPTLLKLEHKTVEKIRFSMRNPSGAWTFDMTADARSFLISKVGSGPMLEVTDTGVLKIAGAQVYP